MKVRFQLLIIVAPLLFSVGCGGPAKVREPVSADKAPAQLASNRIATATPTPTPSTAVAPNLLAARRFLNAWGAGEVIKIGFDREVAKMKSEQPGMAELMQRVFADIKLDELQDMAARVYARHLDAQRLTELADFTETPTGTKFFKTAINAVVEGKKMDNTAMRQFSADELTAILKFSQSEAFTFMQSKLPTINREMAEEGKKMGETKLREYLKNH